MQWRRIVLRVTRKNLGELKRRCYQDIRDAIQVEIDTLPDDSRARAVLESIRDRYADLGASDPAETE